MAYSYDYNRTADLREGESRSRTETQSEGTRLSKAALQSLAGGLMLGILLVLSGNANGLFMKELISVSAVWALVSLVRLQGEPNSTGQEKR